MFPTVNLKADDVVSTWAGLRPLIFEEGKSASELSRKDEIMVSDSGLISIAGGKLTGYRLMSEKIVDLVAKRINKSVPSCATKNYRLSGGEFADETAFNKYLEQLTAEGNSENVPVEKIKEWFYRYGTNTRKVLACVSALRSKIADEEKLFEAAELQYSIENEMIYHLNDFLVRRTGKIFFDIKNSAKQIDYLGNILSLQLNLDDTHSNSDLSSVKQEFLLATSFS